MAARIRYQLKQTMGKFLPGILIASLSGIFFYTYIYYSQEGIIPFTLQQIPILIMSMVLFNLVALSVYYSNHLLNKLIPWQKSISIRFLTGIIINTIISILVSYLLAGSIISFLKDITVSELMTAYREPAIKLAILLLISVVIYSVIYFALYSYNQYAVVQIETVKHERKQLSLQFEALKSQLSPHYLFNCLNTVSSLVYKDKKLAETFIRRLAQTYQYILSTNKEKLVPLAKEIDFVKSYYYLLKVRFENSFDLKIDLSPELNSSQLPPLTIQILVENAVKHNVFSKENPLEVLISCDDGKYLKVINNKSEKPASVSSFKVGLDNIKKRYQFFTNKNIEVRNKSEFMVKLPLLESGQTKISGVRVT